MKKNSLLLFPFNGNSIEALNCISDKYDIIGFIDDDIEKQKKEYFGLKVYSKEILEKNKDAKILAVPGNPNNFVIRKKIIESLNVSIDRFATVIHPSATISKYTDVGNNVLIMAGVVATSNLIIGNNVCILPNTVIHHDSVIEDYCLIGSNCVIAGNVIIKKNCYIGSGTTVINNIEIGENSLIGLGSNVIKSMPANIKAAGNPARILG